MNKKVTKKSNANSEKNGVKAKKNNTKLRNIVIAIIALLILVSLVSFGVKLISDKNKSHNNKPDTVEQNDTNNKTTENKEEKVIDNSYELALAAVIEAEEKIDKKTYSKALDLVSKVANKERKEELSKRLDEVKKSVDSKELVAELEIKTISASNKASMDSARKFNSDNKIEELVESLLNEELKKNLKERLSKLSKLLDDTELTIGIEDGAVFDSNVKIIIEDKNEITITLNGIEVENGTEVSDGTYKLKVKDAAFNEKTINFTVDTITPVATITYDIILLTNKDVVATLNPSEDVTITNNGGSLKYTFKENGTFTFEFEDIAGHKGTATATVENIDKVLNTPIIEYKYGALTNQDEVVTLTFDEEIIFDLTAGLWTNKGNNVYEKQYFNDIQEIKYKDKAGNEGSIIIEIDYIDKELNTPTIEYKYGTLTNQDEVVTLTFDEEVVLDATWINKGNNVYEKTYIENTSSEEEVNYKDLAGNTGFITIEKIDYIDKELNTPTIEYKYGTLTNQDEVVTLTFDEEVVLDATWINKGNNVYEKTYIENTSSEEEVNYKDLAGNTGSITIEKIDYIDKELNTPTIEYKYGTLTNQDEVVTLTFEEEVVLDATWIDKGNNVYEKTYIENTSSEEEVNYKDLAGNTGSITIEKIDYIDKVAPEFFVENREVKAVDGETLSVVATVTDNVDQTKTIEPKTVIHTSNKPVELIEGKINISNAWAGAYTLTYEVEDTAGNKVTKNITIKVLKSDVRIIFDATNLTSSEYNGKNKLSNIKVHLEDNNGILASNTGDIIFNITEMTNAGTYTIKANVNQETTGYKYVEEETFIYEIKQAELSIDFPSTTEVFFSTNRTINPTIKNKSGDIMNITPTITYTKKATFSWQEDEIVSSMSGFGTFEAKVSIAGNSNYKELNQVKEYKFQL